MKYENELVPISGEVADQIFKNLSTSNLHYSKSRSNDEIAPRKVVPRIEDAILMILSCDEKSKFVLSRTLLMKETFLFYEEFLNEFGFDSKADTDAGYFPYKYGPYSIKTNVAIASLAMSGEIRISNFSTSKNFQSLRPDEIEMLRISKRYLALFETDLDFSVVVKPYLKKYPWFRLDIGRFREDLSQWKRTWDQKTAKGIVNYIYHNRKYEAYLGNSELKNKFPEVFMGKVKEDYLPRMVVK